MKGNIEVSKTPKKLSDLEEEDGGWRRKKLFIKSQDAVETSRRRQS